MRRNRMPQLPRNGRLAMDCKMMESGVKAKLRELLAKDYVDRNKQHLMEAASWKQYTRNSMLAKYHKVRNSMVVRNCKVWQSTSLARNSRLAKNCGMSCEVEERNITMIRNYKVQQSTKQTRSSMLAKNCELEERNSILARNSKVQQ